MEKALSLGLLVLFSGITLVACSNGENSNSTTAKTSTSQIVENKDNNKDADEKFQTVLNDYSSKLKDKAPKLVAEYNDEYSKNTSGVEGLTKLSNDKIAKLAEISNEGIQKMAEIHSKNGSGQYKDYEDWTMKLNDVYMDQAQLITDAYLKSASGEVSQISSSESVTKNNSSSSSESTEKNTSTTEPKETNSTSSSLINETNDITKFSKNPTEKQKEVLRYLAKSQFKEQYPYKGSKIHTVVGAISDWEQKDGAWTYKANATIVNAFGVKRDAVIGVRITPVAPDSGLVEITEY